MQFVDLLAVSLCLSLGSRPILAAFPAECGRARPSGQAVVINGEDANALEFPWHAGLYSKVSQEWTYSCGGSLIHKSFVLTAAHCLYKKAEYARIINAENLKVSFGSPFLDGSRITPYVQRRNVSRTFPHPNYRGSQTTHANDIALVELDQPITFTESVRPICVDRDGLPLKDGSKGKVVGWGLSVLSSDTPSTVLKSAEMPFIPFDRCFNAVHPDFRLFLSSSEKFCAGQIGGAAVAPGDSGGGLAFPVNGRWWLSGIVSVGPNRDRLSYATFTRVASHKDWLDRVVNMVEETQEPSSLTECGKARVGGQAAGIPWHAGLYVETSKGWLQIGEGSLIHESFVLTAAHVLYDHGKRIKTENFTVSFGGPFRDLSRDSPNVQRRNVSRTIEHPSYARYLARYYVCDIAVLELDQPVTFTNNVYPICVDRGEAPLHSGSKGTLLQIKTSYKNFYIFTLPIDGCLDLVEDTFLTSLTQDKFCAGQIGGTALVPGSGGGLAYPINGRWWLLGIATVGQRNSSLAFTRVGAHKEWLDAFLKM